MHWGSDFQILELKLVFQIAQSNALVKSSFGRSQKSGAGGEVDWLSAAASTSMVGTFLEVDYPLTL